MSLFCLTVSYKIADVSVWKYQLFRCFKQVNYCSNMKVKIVTTSMFFPTWALRRKWLSKRRNISVHNFFPIHLLRLQKRTFPKFKKPISFLNFSSSSSLLSSPSLLPIPTRLLNTKPQSTRLPNTRPLSMRLLNTRPQSTRLPNTKPLNMILQSTSQLNMRHQSTRLLNTRLPNTRPRSTRLLNTRHQSTKK